MAEVAGPGLGLPCYLPVPSGKGPEASSRGPEPAPTAIPHTLPVSPPEAPASGQGQTAEHLWTKYSGWGLLSHWCLDTWVLGPVGFCCQEVTSFLGFVAEVPYTELPKGTSVFLTVQPHP